MSITPLNTRHKLQSLTEIYFVSNKVFGLKYSIPNIQVDREALSGAHSNSRARSYHETSLTRKWDNSLQGPFHARCSLSGEWCSHIRLCIQMYGGHCLALRSLAPNEAMSPFSKSIHPPAPSGPAAFTNSILQRSVAKALNSGFSFLNLSVSIPLPPSRCFSYQAFGHPPCVSLHLLL